VSAKLRRNIALLTMTAASGLILPWAGADARKPEGEPGRPAAAEPNRGAMEAQERAAQASERNSQMAEARAQQEQGRQQQEQSMKQFAEAQKQQEQQLRAQEQQSHKAQEDAQKAQQEQVRAQQEQARSQQQQQARAQQDQGRAQQEQAREQQEQARAQQQQQQQQARGEQGREPQHAAMMERAPGGPGGQPEAARNGQGNNSFSFAKDRGGNPVFNRAAAPPQIAGARLPLHKAMAMPALGPNARPEDTEHLQEVQRNLQEHMYAVAAANAPSNFHSMPNFARQAYFNNYQTMINNQQLTITRQNTFINALEQSQWPVWYQPEPNWQFANSMTLGNSVVADLNWLRWGWHPYYGPQPDGFVCANDFVPTPWIYMPAYGTWRQPGVNSYSAYGPPYDYTGPISVEVFEPRHVNYDVPFGGFLPQKVITAVYFYNAYYYPESGRYGYMNRHNNWIWLNTGSQPF